MSFHFFNWSDGNELLLLLSEVQAAMRNIIKKELVLSLFSNSLLKQFCAQNTYEETMQERSTE
jgi:hypothetical protein